MATKTILISENDNLFERSDIVSGALSNPNSSEGFGVIFISGDDPKEELDPNDLINASIINTHEGAARDFPLEERTFEIVGGYFFKRNDPDNKIANKVFGIALNPLFGITKGGDTVLADNSDWIHKETKQNSSIDERQLGEEVGWTFIVSDPYGRDRSRYPPSGSPSVFEVEIECPEISLQDPVLKSQSDTEQTYTFSVEVDGPAPDAYSWSFDNGDPEITTTEPSLEKSFTKPADQELSIKITVTTQSESGACDPASAEMEVTLPPVVCPEITSIADVETRLDDQKQTIQLTANFTGPKPDLFKWSFNGELPDKETVSNRTTCTFDRPLGPDKTLTVTLSTVGPFDNCSDDFQKEITLKGVCPEISAMTFTAEDVSTDPTGTEQEFEFKLEGKLLNAAGLSFEWDFGDGNTETTTSPQASHKYTRPDGDDTNLTVKVVVIGAEGCDVQAEVPIIVVGRCPTLKVYNVDRVGDLGSLEYDFSVETEGPNPTSYEWNFGDGNQDTTNVPHTTHIYEASSANQTISTSVIVKGPGENKCQLNGLKEFILEVPVVCPEITEFNIVKQSVADDPKGTEQSISFTLEGKKLNDPGLTFEWNFGDGITRKTTTPQSSHIYTRPDGDDKEFQVSVQITGLEGCDVNDETTVIISGRCPVLKSFNIEPVPPPGSLTYLFSVETEGPNPTSYEWDFGDGNTATTTASEVSHTYNLASGNQELTIQVIIKGPGGSKCEITSTRTLIPDPPCPQIAEITLSATVEEAHHVYTFNKTIIGPEPTSCKWDFGDGSPIVDDCGDNVTHRYDRLLGGTRNLTVKLTIEGPDNCNSFFDKEIEIEGRCPEISLIKVNAQDVSSDPTGTQQTFAFTLEGSLLNEPGLRFEWVFGDGHTAKSSVPQINHIYTRPDGDNQQFTVQVRIQGVDGCDVGGTTSIIVDSRCPIIKEYTITPMPPAGSLQYTFAVQTEGPAPTSYDWDFGDGTTRTTTLPQTPHTYNESFGNVELTTQVTVKGPGQQKCEVSQIKTFKPDLIICPTIKEVICEDRVEGDKHIFTFRKVVDQGVPTECIWDFGDGNSLSDCSETVRHEYQILPGDPRALTVKLTIKGPDESCEEFWEKEITVEGICPTISIKSCEIEEESRKKSKVTIDMEVNPTNAVIDGYTIDWGDGSIVTQELKQPPFVHIYDRVGGEDKSYTIKILSFGPGNCTDEVEKVVEISKCCPAFNGEPVCENTIGDLTVEASISFSFIDIPPETCSIDWGDGSSEVVSSSGGLVNHTYNRKNTGDQTYSATIVCTGPGDCRLEFTCDIPVPGLCPRITNIQKEIINQTDTQLTVKFTAIVEGELPTNFAWDFGDNNTKSSTGPSITHVYTRPEGDDETYPVSLAATGPEQCETTEITQCPVPGRCPVIINIQKQTLELTPTIQKVKFTAIIAGPTPDSYSWDFGDGTPAGTTGPEIIHDFVRPGGDDKVYTVTLTTTGPDNCTATETTECELEGICPSVGKIELTKKAPTIDKQEVEVSLEIIGPPADTYTWNWGDNSPLQTTNVPEASHEYTRPFGDDQVYQITVAVEGPDNCRCDVGTSVDIEGVCPEVDTFELTVVEPTGPQQSIIATVMTTGPTPTSYIWDCGDGNPPVTTVVPTYTCVYDRPEGDDESVIITVTLEGPGNCLCSKSEEAVLKGICPEIEMGEIVIIATDKTTQEVKATVNLLGTVTPDKYCWDWGDGSAIVETLVPMANHIYTRPPGDDVEYPITVTAKGPDSCESSVGGVVKIKGVCPEVKGIIPSLTTPTDTEQEVCITVITEGPTPDKYLWDWGDGFTEETTTGESCHTYSRPLGDDVDYMVKITVIGPGECSCMGTALVQIEGICPSVRKIIPTLEPPTAIHQVAKITLEIEGPPAEKYLWDWGDGHTEEKMVPEALHAYERPEGDDIEYTIMVKLDGPGDCDCMASALISIRGICPEITDITCELKDPADGKQELTATASVLGPAPNKYIWDWGDGSASLETVDPTATHVYDQPAGVDKTYELTLTVEGPDSCSHHLEKDITILKQCPTINSLTLTPDPAGPDTQTVRAELDLSGPPPTQFVWNWGDGSKPETTIVPYATHEYMRPEGDDETYCVSVYVQGPGECMADDQGEVIIKGVCPEITELKSTEIAIDSTTQTMRIEVVYTGPAPDKFVWTIGSEAPVDTATPWIEHVFTRMPGNAVSYPVKVELLGPDSCNSSDTTNVMIAGICPTVSSITPVLTTSTDTHQEVSVTVAIDGPLPIEMIWNWGDNSAEETITVGSAADLTQTHSYERPGDADQAYTINVKANGPGDCMCSASAQVIIEGSCPVVTNIMASFGPLTATDQEVTVTVEVDRSDEIDYEWDWGDGTITTTDKIPTATHTYKREGVDTSYILSVRLTGPGACSAEECLTINIKGTCPSIVDIKQNYGAWDGKCQTIKFTVVTQDGEHDTYQWDWGDGSAIEKGPERSREHTFLAGDDENSKFEVTVLGKGPKPDDGDECDDCESSKTVEVLLPGSCPIIVDIKSIRGATEPDSQKITFAAITRGPGPETYLWEVKGLVREETDGPDFSYEFERVASADRTYEVELSIKGPNNGVSCEHSYLTSIVIPKID